MKKRVNVIERPGAPDAIPVGSTVQGDVFEVVTALVPAHEGLVCIKGYAGDGDTGHNYVSLIDGARWSGSPTWMVRLLDRITITRKGA